MTINSVLPTVEYTLGFSPCTILIDTDDDVATVMTTGYLNGRTDLAAGFSNTQMALVITSAGLIWLQVSIVGEDTSLIAPASI